MSGTYDLRRFFDATDDFSDDFWVSSPLHFVPTLAVITSTCCARGSC
jgi:esterase/lipase superfamily enzyme